MLPSILVWLIGFAGYFAAFELTAVFWRNCPWDTLSSTVWWLIQISHGWFALLIVGCMTILTVHWVAPKVFDSAQEAQTRRLTKLANKHEARATALRQKAAR